MKTGNLVSLLQSSIKILYFLLRKFFLHSALKLTVCVRIVVKSGESPIRFIENLRCNKTDGFSTNGSIPFQPTSPLVWGLGTLTV